MKILLYYYYYKDMLLTYEDHLHRNFDGRAAARSNYNFIYPLILMHRIGMTCLKMFL